MEISCPEKKGPSSQPSQLITSVLMCESLCTGGSRPSNKGWGGGGGGKGSGLTV